MIKGTGMLAAGLALLATVVMAAEATEPNALARQQLMEQHGKQMGVLGGMAQGKIPFDAAQAAAAKAALTELAPQIVPAFKTESTDPKSEALPAIWQNFGDFTAKAEAMTAAANAADVSSLDAIQASIGAIGSACAGCHKAYRAD